jgi:hypothetical protein
LDLQLRHLPGARRRCFYVDSGCSRTFSSGTSWIPDGDRWWPRHRHLQFQWWLLPNLAASTPRGPPSTSSTSVVAAVGSCRQHPPRGPPLTSSTSVVAAAGPCHQHPRRPAIDVFNFGGDRYRTLPPAPTGAPPSTSSTSVVAAAGPCRQQPQGAHH